MKWILSCACYTLLNFGFSQVIYKTDDLIIHQLTRSVYVHETFLETEEYGRVSCNGMVVINDGKAAVVDTPSESYAAIELINWVEKDMRSQIQAVVVNHHHVDCLGSLDEFHKRGITSYSSKITRTEAETDGYPIPKITFETFNQIQVGQLSVVNRFFGPGHAQGNIVSYVVGEEVLFGGCQVKSLKSGKGNLGDADTDSWPITIKSVKKAFPTVRYVIPGHGKVGGLGLLDYTIEMFEN